MAGQAFFVLCALVAVVSALLTVTMRSPLRAAMSLLAHVVSLAGLYLTLHAHLLAAVQLIVYAGAIVVLFVFVIMLMGPGAEGHPSVSTRGWVVKAIAAGLVVMITGAVAVGVGTAVIARPGELTTCTPDQTDCVEFGGVDAVAQAIFVDGAIPFEVVSVLLLVAVISAIAVAKGRSATEKDFTDAIEARRLAPRAFPEDAAGPPLNPIVSTGEDPPAAEPTPAE